MKWCYYSLLCMVLTYSFVACTEPNKVSIETERTGILYVGTNEISISFDEKVKGEIVVKASSGELVKKSEHEYQLNLNSLGQVTLDVLNGTTPLLTETYDIKFNLKEYYLPYKELKEGLVYEYQAVNKDSVPPFYWYYKSFDSVGDWTLTGTSYDYNYQVEQFVKEEIVSNGTLVNTFRLYEYQPNSDYAIPVDATIESPSMFPFEMSDTNSIILFKMHWQESIDSLMTNTIIRNRRFRGYTDFEYKGKVVDCIEIEMKEEIELDHKEEGVRNYRPISKEIYAKGIGLVYYKKWLSSEMFLEYALRDRYSMEEFEKKAK